MTGASPATAPRAGRTGIRLVRVPNGRVGAVAVHEVAETVADHPRAVLGVATGSTPLELYAALARRRTHGLRTDAMTLVALDEYVGLGGDDPRDYATYVRRTIATPLGIPDDRVHVPSGTTDADAAAFEHGIAGMGGVDLQILGIGRNGHIGFNEPGADAASRTRIVSLDEVTRRANAEHFDGDLDAVPTHAITQGVGTILDARRILLLAAGRGKAAALRAALTGPVSAEVPASYLQRHPAVVVIADDDACEELE